MERKWSIFLQACGESAVPARHSEPNKAGGGADRTITSWKLFANEEINFDEMIALTRIQTTL